MTGSRRARSWWIGFASLLLAAAGLPGDSRSQGLVADLSEHLVAITTGFSGSNVLLFGAVDEPGDIAVVVRGPYEPVRLHRKSRVAGIWINTAAVVFESVPSFYAVAASDPLEEIASESVRARHHIGVENLDLGRPSGSNDASEAEVEAWRDALIRAKQRQNLYMRSPARVSFLGNRLFRADVIFPANVPTGSYLIEVFLLNEGRVVSAQTTPLVVGKIGLQADLYDFALRYSAYYGVFAILLALVAGWLGHVVFRKS